MKKGENSSLWTGKTFYGTFVDATIGKYLACPVILICQGVIGNGVVVIDVVTGLV